MKKQKVYLPSSFNFHIIMMIFRSVRILWHCCCCCSLSIFHFVASFLQFSSNDVLCGGPVYIAHFRMCFIKWNVYLPAYNGIENKNNLIWIWRRLQWYNMIAFKLQTTLKFFCSTTVVEFHLFAPYLQFCRQFDDRGAQFLFSHYFNSNSMKVLGSRNFSVFFRIIEQYGWEKNDFFYYP